ncbi:hypothetical protein C2U70_04795 [Bradyrhizobium guangdongense]|uniref:hypothetical protein n=1 Tax=Bradyrhizobium guangdongense TaxID=1325090 RepID=UPI00112EE1AD|nr:hypothetical protein [Bradyrhizobium guangdongense]TPQ40609.1 hypothetical protein C2U70_04795 [Bradyrhizobium guangdongense]
MTAVSDDRTQPRTSAADEPAGGDERLDALIGRLPPRVGGAVNYLLKPSNRWIRIPSGALLVAGGVLSVLPLLGIWMLPLGLALLAEDVPALRASRSKALDWIERRKPEWLAPSTPPDEKT